MTALGPDGLPRTVPPGAAPAGPADAYAATAPERTAYVEDSIEYEAGVFEPEPDAHDRAESASIGELLSDVSAGLSTLLHQEVELAKAEAREAATKAGKGAGMLSGAAVAGWFTLLFLSLAVWEWLSGAMDNRGWAAIVVMAIWAIVAAVLGLRGRQKIKDIQGMPRTVETARRVPDALKGNEDHR